MLNHCHAFNELPSLNAWVNWASGQACKRQWEIMCTNCIRVESAFQGEFVAFSYVIVILLADILRSNSGRFYKHIDIRYYTIKFVKNPFVLMCSLFPMCTHLVFPCDGINFCSDFSCVSFAFFLFFFSHFHAVFPIFIYFPLFTCYFLNSPIGQHLFVCIQLASHQLTHVSFKHYANKLLCTLAFAIWLFDFLTSNSWTINSIDDFVSIPKRFICRFDIVKCNSSNDRLNSKFLRHWFSIKRKKQTQASWKTIWNSHRPVEKDQMKKRKYQWMPN